MFIEVWARFGVSKAEEKLPVRCAAGTNLNSDPKKKCLMVSIPSGLYRAQKAREILEKNIKYKIPHPGLGPENQKNNAEKKYENGLKTTIFIFFFVLLGPNPGGGVCIFSYLFVFAGSHRVLGLCTSLTESQLHELIPVTIY